LSFEFELEKGTHGILSFVSHHSDMTFQFALTSPSSFIINVFFDAHPAEIVTLLGQKHSSPAERSFFQKYSMPIMVGLSFLVTQLLKRSMAPAARLNPQTSSGGPSTSKED